MKDSRSLNFSASLFRGAVLFFSLSGLFATGCAGSERDDDGSNGDGDTSVLPACSSSQDLCEGSCVDFQSDGNHCGECENACEGGRVCSLGLCRSQCAEGLTQCGSSCVEGSCGGSAPGSGGAQSNGTGGSSSSGGSSNLGTGGVLIIGDKFVGNITTGDQVDTTGKRFADHWDQITPENAGKWGSVEWNAGAGYNWGTLDAIYAYTQDNGIIFKQHAFVWGEQQPGGNIGENDVKNWMQAFCDRYPNTKLIDVVNEPPPHTTPGYVNSIGGGTDGDWAWITNSFKWARERCPNAILILNDYNNIEWDGDSEHFIDIVNKTLASGAPIDAVGAQSHDLDHEDVDTEKMKRLLAQLHEQTGLPVYITEYDISTTDDNAQLEKYKEQMPFFLAAEYVHGITIWGWVEGQTWSKAPNSGLISGSGNPRPAMTWLMDLLQRPVP